MAGKKNEGETAKPNANYKRIGGTLHTFRSCRARGTLNHEVLSVPTAERMTYYDKLT